jgi:hypothetical protein
MSPVLTLEIVGLVSPDRPHGRLVAHMLDRSEAGAR